MYTNGDVVIVKYTYNHKHKYNKNDKKQMIFAQPYYDFATITDSENNNIKTAVLPNDKTYPVLINTERNQDDIINVKIFPLLKFLLQAVIGYIAFNKEIVLIPKDLYPDFTIQDVMNKLTLKDYDNGVPELCMINNDLEDDLDEMMDQDLSEKDEREREVHNQDMAYIAEYRHTLNLFIDNNIIVKWGNVLSDKFTGDHDKIRNHIKSILEKNPTAYHLKKFI